MSYRILVTQPAAQDRDACFDYIIGKSPQGAIHWLEAYEDAIQSLRTNPKLGLAPENEDHKEEIRQRLFKTQSGLPYRLIYLIRNDAIYILHLRGPGQNLINPDDFVFPES